MNESNQELREQLEVRIVAMLLGEASAFETAQLQEILAKDPELAAFHDRMKGTIGLAQEASKKPEVAAQPAAMEPKLSAERREVLLAHFRQGKEKVVPLPEPKRRRIGWLVPLTAAAAIVVLIGVFLPSLSRSKSRSQRAAIAHSNVKGNPDFGANFSGDERNYSLKARESVNASSPTPSVPQPVAAPEPSVEGSSGLYLPRRGAVAWKMEEQKSQSDRDHLIVLPSDPNSGQTLALNDRSSQVLSEDFKNSGTFDRFGGKVSGGPEGKDKQLAGNSVDLGNLRTVYYQYGAGQTTAGSVGAGATGVSTDLFSFNFQTLDDRNVIGRRANESVPVTNLTITNGWTPHLKRSELPFPKPVAKNSSEESRTKFEAKASDEVSLLALQEEVPSSRSAKTGELEELRRERAELALKIEQEQVESSLPLSLSATIVDRAEAEPANKSTLGDKEKKRQMKQAGIRELEQRLAIKDQEIGQAQQEQDRLRKKTVPDQIDAPAKKPVAPPPTPQPEINTRENAFSTFSLNVSDVSFKLAAASLQNSVMPEAGSIRVEEFINAFNYRDPAPAPGSRLAFAWERARYPFAHNRDVVRFSVQTAAQGRDAQKPLNLVILLDNSGSMERADRVAIVKEALKVLAQKLGAQDRISVVAFSRTARLQVDGVAGGDAQTFLNRVLDLNPEGGTNMEEALDLAYATALRHFMPAGANRVILLTDGAANLGNIEPEELKQKVIAHRQKGIALDCFGIGWEGYNDDLLEVLSRNGDGRYGFLNQLEQAGPEFANQLAGALNVAASDVKTQVEFNPNRVTSWRQIGYARHQLTKEQFRDNTIDAAEIAAAEQGNALYVIETNPEGSGPIGVVRVRFKVPATGEYMEREWPLPYEPRAPALDQSSSALRLAVTASAFGEWLSTSPFAAEVTLPALQGLLGDVPETFAPDPRPQQLKTMVSQARGIAGK